jgi:hypothetical protein
MIWSLFLGSAVLSGSGRSAPLRPSIREASRWGSPLHSVLTIDATSAVVYYYVILMYNSLNSGDPFLATRSERVGVFLGPTRSGAPGDPPWRGTPGPPPADSIQLTSLPTTVASVPPYPVQTSRITRAAWPPPSSENSPGGLFSTARDSWSIS